MKSTIFVILVLSLLTVHRATSQCSDAGVCSLGHIEEKDRYSAGIRFQYGASGGNDRLFFRTVALEASARILDGTRLSASAPLSSVSGPLGSASGPGDVTLLLEQTMLAEDGLAVSAQAGVKLATGNSNHVPSLPQAYQPALGSTDLLFGLAARINTWGVGAGYQFAGERNSNTITRLKRGDDLLLWAGTEQRLGDFTASAKVLAIKRLSVSSIRSATTPVEPAVYTDVPESDNLQVNIQAGLALPVTNNLTLEGAAAFPFLQREVNIDGLKRAYSFSIGVSTSF